MEPVHAKPLKYLVPDKEKGTKNDAGIILRERCDERGSQRTYATESFIPREFGYQERRPATCICDVSDAIRLTKICDSDVREDGKRLGGKGSDVQNSFLTPERSSIAECSPASKMNSVHLSPSRPCA
jgi:hypothetical protein